MKRLFRFPFAWAATVLTASVALVAATGELDVVQISHAVASLIDPRWVDDILTVFVLLVAAITIDVNRARHAAAEQERAAAARAAREFRALFAANPLPMSIYDLTTLQFLEVNDAAVQHYGYGRDEFLAMTIKDLRFPEEVEGLLTRLGERREAWQEGSSWRHRVKSGQIIDVEIASHTITFAGRSAALVVAQDITERKRAEEEIRNHAHLSALAAVVGLSLTDTDSPAHALHQCAEALVTHLRAAEARISDHPRLVASRGIACRT